MSRYIWVVAAVNLQYISDILRRTWAFLIAIESATHWSTSYLDMRIRMYLPNYKSIENFHFMAFPMHNRHTGALMYETVINFLDIVDPDWHVQLLSISNDSARSMTRGGARSCEPSVRGCTWMGILDLVWSASARYFHAACSQWRVEGQFLINSHGLHFVPRPPEETGRRHGHDVSEPFQSLALVQKGLQVVQAASSRTAGIHRAQAPRFLSTSGVVMLLARYAVLHRQQC